LRLPPNLVKPEDTRTKGYQERFKTDKCWELDALGPEVIEGLIRTELKSLINQKRWTAAQRKEKQNHDLMQKVATNWALVQKAIA